MTRETRIGLLVGLVFIVMFGIVLGELTGTSRPERDDGPPVVGGPEQDWSPVIEDARPVQIDPVAQVAVRTGARRETPASAEAPLVRSTLIALDDSAREVFVGVEMREMPPSAPPSQRPRIYTVQPNDSLRKIARKVYGPDREGLYRKIFQANRNILSDESMVHIGQELVIPALPVEAPPQQAGVPGQLARQSPPGAPTGPGPRRYEEMNLRQLRSHFASGSQQRPRPSGRIYVVREGDNLSRIARKMLKDDSRSAVKRIYDANRDRLTSPDLLSVGIELRIPS